MVRKMLDSKPIKEVGKFEIEFSEFVFDERLIEETSGFIEQFWSMVDELGFSEKIQPIKRQLNWKSRR